MKLKLTNVRLAFPALFEAKTVNGEGAAAFSGSFLIDPADPQVKTINDAIEATAKDKWGAKAEGLLSGMRKADKVCLHDGDLKASYDGFPGNLFISARNQARPVVLGADKTPLVAADGKPYAGCYVNVTLDLWAQDNKYGKRVNATLMGVQFYRDGDSFTGGGSGSADDFDDVTTGATADDLA
jgi:hypothetical protein